MPEVSLLSLKRVYALQFFSVSSVTYVPGVVGPSSFILVFLP